MRPLRAALRWQHSSACSTDELSEEHDEGSRNTHVSTQISLSVLHIVVVSLFYLYSISQLDRLADAQPKEHTNSCQYNRDTAQANADHYTHNDIFKP